MLKEKTILVEYCDICDSCINVHSFGSKKKKKHLEVCNDCLGFVQRIGTLTKTDERTGITNMEFKKGFVCASCGSTTDVCHFESRHSSLSLCKNCFDLAQNIGDSVYNGFSLSPSCLE